VTNAHFSNPLLLNLARPSVGKLLPVEISVNWVVVEVIWHTNHLLVEPGTDHFNVALLFKLTAEELLAGHLQKEQDLL